MLRMLGPQLNSPMLSGTRSRTSPRVATSEGVADRERTAHDALQASIWPTASMKD
jgi:hypothetical protein